MENGPLIVKSFRDVVAASTDLTRVLPGRLHHGTRVNTSVGRPFGLMTVKEVSRWGISGGSVFVSYEATLKIYGHQNVGVVGYAQNLFAIAFDARRDYPSVEGQVISTVPGESSLVEEKLPEFEQDIVVGTQAWAILIQQPSVSQ